MAEFFIGLLGGVNPSYPYMPSSTPLAPFVLSLVACLAIWWWFNKTIFAKARPTTYLWMCFAFVCLLQWQFQQLPSRNTSAMIENGDANSFWTVSQQYPLVSYLRQFSELRSQLPLHATSNMPGKVLFFYALNVFGDSRLFLACAILLLSNLGGLFLYAITLRLTRDVNAALAAAILYWLCPARIYFFPLLNTVTPTFILGSIWLWLRAVESPRWTWISLNGLGFFVLFIFEPLPLVCGLFHLWLLGYAWWRKSISGAQVLQIGVGTLLAFAAGVYFMGVLTGFHSIREFLEIVRVNSRFYSSYQVSGWFFSNIINLIVGFGYASLFVLVGGWGVLRDLVAAPDKTMLGYVGTFLITLLVLNGAGVTRAEIMRLWIFMLAVLYPVVGLALAHLQKRRNVLPWVAAANGLQTVCGLHYIGFVWWP